MQSHGGPQLVAELPHCPKKQQATVRRDDWRGDQPERSPWASCSLAQLLVSHGAHNLGSCFVAQEEARCDGGTWLFHFWQ